MAEYLVVLAFAHFILLLVAYRFFGLADLRVYIIAVFLLYGISYPVDALFFNVRVGLNSEELINLNLLFFGFVFFFFIGGLIFVRSKGPVVNCQYYQNVYFLCRLFFLGAMIVYFFYVSQYWEVARADRNYLYLNPVLGLSISKIAVSIYFLSLIAVKPAGEKLGKFSFALFLIYCLSEGLLFGDRRIVATCLVTAFFLVNLNRRVYLRIYHFLILFFLGFLSLFIERTRYGGGFSEGLTDGGFNPALGELGAPWVVALDMYEALDFFNVTSTSFWDAFLVLVPRFVWPDRPLGAGEWFVQSYHPEIASQGGGFAYSFLVELLTNFSIFGYFLASFLIGFIVSKLSGFKSCSGRLGFLVICFAIVFLPRYDMATILKSFLISIILISPLFFLLILNRLGSRGDGE